MCGRNAQFAAVLLSGTLLVNRASAWAGRRKRSRSMAKLSRPTIAARISTRTSSPGTGPLAARIATRLAGPHWRFPEARRPGVDIIAGASLARRTVNDHSSTSFHPGCLGRALEQALTLRRVIRAQIGP